MIAHAVRKGVQGAAGAGKAAKEQSQRKSEHKSAYAARRYVILTDPGSDAESKNTLQLETSLQIPEAHFSTLVGSASNLPQVKLSELLAATTAAQKTLKQAKAMAKQAHAASGFKPGVGKIALGGVRGAMPLSTFIVTGFRLDAQACKAALKKMKEAERLLESYWQQLQAVLDALEGAVTIVAPNQPLALTSLLHTLEPGSTTNLASCEHPVVRALSWKLSLGPAEAAAQQGTSDGQKGSGERGLSSGGRGRLGRGRREGGPFSMLRDGLKFARGSNKGMSAAQVADRNSAIAIAAGACDADTLEFERLAEQTEKLGKWLTE